MEKQYIISQLNVIAAAVDYIDEQNRVIKNSLCHILGCITADDYLSNGYGNQNSSEEIKQMIIDLNVKGSVRERKSGLIELRTQAFGSIYGRTKAEIEQKLNQKLKEARTQKLSPGKKSTVPTFSQFYSETFYPYKQQSVTADTLRSIRQSYSTFIQKGLDVPLNKITAMQIEQVLISIDKSRTRQVMRSFINTLMEYAKQLGLIKENPCDNVSQVKHDKNIGRALSFKEQASFFNTLFGSDKIPLHKKLYFTFVYLTGTRRSEALAVKFSDIHFDENYMHIPGTKTKTSNRDFPLFPQVRKIIELMPQAQDRIFNYEKSYATHTMKEAAPDHHLHELRHTFGTIAICVQKLDPKTVALYMGHSDPSTTLRIYTHPEQLDKALFFDGSKSDAEKLEILRAEYAEILAIIDDFLENVPKSYPNNMNPQADATHN